MKVKAAVWELVAEAWLAHHGWARASGFEVGSGLGWVAAA